MTRDDRRIAGQSDSDLRLAHSVLLGRCWLASRDCNAVDIVEMETQQSLVITVLFTGGYHFLILPYLNKDTLIINAYSQKYAC